MVFTANVRYEKQVHKGHKGLKGKDLRVTNLQSVNTLQIIHIKLQTLFYIA